MNRKTTPRRVPLESSLDEWVAAGLIVEGQRSAILARYAKGPDDNPPAQTQPSARGIAWLPRILIGIAVVLVVAGIFLFYASNWRHMPPSAKLVQIFALLLGFYGATFALQDSQDSAKRLLARAFLILGMSSFGACIALVAQVFHISAHPTNGVLAWAVMVALTAWVCREKIGLFMAFGLFAVWNIWEICYYQSPGWTYGPFLVGLGALFFAFRSPAGMISCLAGLLLFFYQTHFRLAEALGSDWVFAGTVMLLLPYGLLLITAGRLAQRVERLALVATVSEYVGWFFAFVPLIGLSWPITLSPDSRTLATALATGARHLPIEYAITTGLAAFCLSRLRNRGAPLALWWGMLAYAALQFALPMHHKTTWMVFTHLGLVAFALSSTYFTFAAKAPRVLDQTLAIVFTGLVLGAKGAGFIGLGLYSGDYFVAYGVGAVAFAVVILLANQTVFDLLSRRGIPYPRAPLALASVCVLFIGVYMLSFELDPQRSIFAASTLVKTMLVLFLSIAVALLAFAWKRTPEKLLVGVTGGVFVAAAAALFVAGPGVSWVFYSIVFNVLLFVVEGAVIVYGAKSSSKALVMVGIGFFALHVTTRYFDLLWDMFSGSILLIATGVLVMGGGYVLERQRRRLFSHIDEARRDREVLP